MALGPPMGVGVVGFWLVVSGDGRAGGDIYPPPTHHRQTGWGSVPPCPDIFGHLFPSSGGAAE